ncbi:hypothetical protein NDU88_009586 [Pleurodeles waltl]|uniref:Uncharacterized protein n=1 Tax=Pleurodeles waltl TaxID=8319 RepID=A0AAV7PSH6_PLEWA|nr:hypothetical protein NDU88_009586 [Pleurodeles waltl]
MCRGGGPCRLLGPYALWLQDVPHWRAVACALSTVAIKFGDSDRGKSGGGPLPSPLTPTPPDALFFAGCLSRAVQIAAAVPRLWGGFPSLGRPLTLGRGRPRRQRPPAVRVRWLCGHHISLGKSVISPGCTSRSPGEL